MNECEFRVSGKPQCSQRVVLIQMFHKHCNMLQVSTRSHMSQLFFISSDETTPIIAKMVSTGNWTMMWAGWVGDTISPSLIEKGFPCNRLWGHVEGQSQCERVEREEAVIGGLSKKHHFLKNVIVQGDSYLWQRHTAFDDWRVQPKGFDGGVTVYHSIIKEKLTGKSRQVMTMLTPSFSADSNLFMMFVRLCGV